MNDKCFIDTNILIYCYSKDEPIKQSLAKEVALSHNAFISTQVLNELSNILHKKFHLSWKEIENVVSDVISNFNVYIINLTTIESAFKIANSYGYSFYDSLIIAAAIHNDCSNLYSEDMQNGQIIEDNLTIINPFK